MFEYFFFSSNVEKIKITTEIGTEIKYYFITFVKNYFLVLFSQTLFSNTLININNV